MIQPDDIIDRKLIALAGKYKTAISRLIHHSISAEFFNAVYQPLVVHMLEYYKTYFELLTPDALAQILVDNDKDTNSITSTVTTYDDIISDIDLIKDESAIKELDFFIDRIKKRKSLEIFEDASRKIATAVVSSRVEAAKDVMIKAITSYDSIISTGEVLEGSVSDLVQPRLDRYEERKLYPERFKGIQSGFPLLDKVTDGFQPGDLVLYVAESGGGKSVNLLHSGFKAWIEKYPGAGVGANVVLFSLEMDWQQYLRRFDAMHASIDSLKLKSASLSDTEYSAWRACLDFQKQKENFFYIIDVPPGCNIMFIRNKLEEVRMKNPNHPVDLVVIDYLGIMSPARHVEGNDSLQQGIISQEMKELARAERIPVLSAVQETRESIKDTKVKTKNTASIARSQMIVANTNIIVYSQLHQIEEQDEGFEMFASYNKDPNVMHYQVLKSRDSKKVKFRCGVDFSRMLVQPLDLEDEDETLNSLVVNNAAKPADPTRLIDPEDEEELDGYYEKVQRNAQPVERELSAS